MLIVEMFLDARRIKFMFLTTFYDFYLINLWNFLLGGLGWSSRTVIKKIIPRKKLDRLR